MDKQGWCGSRIGWSLAGVLVACGPTGTTAPDGAGSETGDGGAETGDFGEESTGGLDDASDESGSGDDGDDLGPPPRGLRMVVARVTEQGASATEDHPGRVDLVEIVDGQLHVAPLLDSLTLVWDGRLQTPRVEGSAEGWLALSYPSGPAGGSDAVWTWDARALMPQPRSGRALAYDEAAPAGRLSWARVVADRLVIASDAGLDVTDPVDDTALEPLIPGADFVRFVEAHGAFVYDTDEAVDTVLITDVASGVTTRLDDPEVGDRGVAWAIADDGSVAVYAEYDRDAGTASLWAIALGPDGPGERWPLPGHAEMQAGFTGGVELSPDGDGVLYQWYHSSEPPAQADVYYSGLRRGPTAHLGQGVWPTSGWSEDGSALVYRPASGNGVARLDRASLEETLVEVDGDPGGGVTVCGDGVVIYGEGDAPARPLVWSDLDGTSIAVAEATYTYRCVAASGDAAPGYLAYATDEGVFVRRFASGTLGAADRIAELAPEWTVHALTTSADGTVLVYRTCPPFDSSWPYQTCPGTLATWDSVTGASVLVFDEGFVFGTQSVVPLPPSAP